MTSTDDSRSITGLPESAVPVQADGTSIQSAASTTSNSSNTPKSSSTLPASASENALPPPLLRSLSATRSLAVSASPSSANSPLSSRDSSPARPPQRQQGMSGALPNRGFRSRKNSQDASPSRPPTLPASGSTVPSAASIQRALSATNTPQLQPTNVQDTSGRSARSQRPVPVSTPGEAANTPHWPISPRLKSPPPPSGPRSRRNSLRSQTTRKSEGNTSAPSIVVQSSTPTGLSPRATPKADAINSDSDDPGPLTMKGSTRGNNAPTLETVQEASAPATPGNDALDPTSLIAALQSDKSQLDRSDSVVAKVSEDLSNKLTKASESGSDSGGNKSEKRGRPQTQILNTARPDVPSSRPSYTSLVLPKIKAGPDAASKNMTVETETVTSIPQTAIAAGVAERTAPGRTEPGGSLRMKASTETIRPKKEKKKSARKAHSITSGTASTKADIFEAKVASAVDEANSSDSDETFVYESNPPEPQPHRSRHHSRTPSATSMASIVEHRNMLRSIGSTLENPRSIPAKRSMKFGNNHYNNPTAADYESAAEGTVRSGHSRSGHHIRHAGRGGSNHNSHFDSDTPFPHITKVRGLSSRNSSQPSSPKYATHSARFGNGARKHLDLSYDMDGEGVADDERTPLIGTVRSNRTRTPRRPNSSSLRQLEHYQRRRGSWLRRFAGCIVMTIMIILLASGAVGFLLATTKPLESVSVREIQNVLASEQELMLDLVVRAVNPNVIAVTVSEMDVNVFAKSKHVGTDKWWREHGDAFDTESTRMDRQRKRELRRRGLAPSSNSRPNGGVDKGTDPISDPDPENDAQTMLLGRIFHFDSALNFEGSPIKRHLHEAIGEVRLPHPGNKTEAGGTERWERVMMYPFELIVRGVLKYQLPLSSTTHNCPIGARIVVHPEKGVDKKGRMWIEPLDGDDADSDLEHLGPLE